MDYSLLPFRGFQPTKINLKGSVCLPQLWKDRIHEDFVMCLDEEDDIIRIHMVPESVMIEWQEESIQPSSEFQPVQLDDRATVTLPLHWCEAAGIDVPGEMIVMGRGRIIDFLSVSNFNAQLELHLGVVHDEDEGP